MIKTRHYENFHIPLWLLKDTFWMLHWKVAGVIMIAPAILVALIITVISIKEKEEQFWVNLAVIFWISANSWWMFCEFYKMEDKIRLALIPFLLGMVSVAVYYIKKQLDKKKAA